MTSNTILSARALLVRAESHCTRSLSAPSGTRERVTHCELAQRYTMQALATLLGPCGVRVGRAGSLPPRRRETDERTAIIPPEAT